jgi:hypothetical protein
MRYVLIALALVGPRPSRLRQLHRAEDAARPSFSEPAGTASTPKLPSRKTRMSTVSRPANWRQWSDPPWVRWRLSYVVATNPVLSVL